jgi:hypothetical protein
MPNIGLNNKQIERRDIRQVYAYYCKLLSLDFKLLIINGLWARGPRKRLIFSHLRVLKLYKRQQFFARVSFFRTYSESALGHRFANLFIQFVAFYFFFIFHNPKACAVLYFVPLGILITL